MATITVKETGGDFSTLASALADAGTVANDVIEISGTWSSADSDECTVSDDNITIQAIGDSKVTTARHVAASPNHYRLITPDAANNDHVIQVDNTGCIIDGLDIFQRSNTASDEGIRMANDGGTLTVKNCIIRSEHNTDDQDGIYAGAISATINVENCIIYYWDRAGLAPQIFSGTHTQTWNVNSCSIWQCGEAGETVSGGIAAYRSGGTPTYIINIHNTWILDCSAGVDDYSEDGGGLGSITWGISYSIDSDNSIATRDSGGTGNQASRTIVDSDQGSGSFVIVNDITGAAPFDLSLQDLSNANNNAQDEHATATAESLTIPSTDIDGTSRPQNTNYDVGAFEFVAATGLDNPELQATLSHRVTAPPSMSYV